MTKKRILGCLRVPPVEYHWSIQLIVKYLTVTGRSSWEAVAEIQWTVEHCVDVLKEVHTVRVWAPRQGRRI
jgi:hypothetical protein